MPAADKHENTGICAGGTIWPDNRQDRSVGIVSCQCPKISGFPPQARKGRRELNFRYFAFLAIFV